ncbi:hypothetical protein PAPYR_8954 [Paratrimastix pyriformis]|uniref:Uncharacterized protein n=1 Tax=Paratrimastix pyriformis TaxID=342808 RepID=A0ABQ8UF74_9EUKA|nr:hypothetical protein PAPYR_8954 [Paratrimastix pyriformis]
MDCPHLRFLECLPGDQNLARSMPMHELVEAGGGNRRDRHLDPAWLPQLVAWSPRLRHLFDVTVSQAMLSHIFAQCPSLTSLRSINLHLTATTDSPAFLLRLPGQLEALDGQVIVEGPEGPAELRVEAPGLRALRLEVPPQMQLTLACPALVALVGNGASSFVEGTDPPLRSLCLECPREYAGHFPIPTRAPPRSKADSLLAVLTRHGSHLQCVSLPSKWLPPEAWPEVAAALGQLPRLVSLTVYGIPSADVVLACPRLSHLTIHRPDFGDRFELRSLVLDCPQLEELSAPFDWDLERFELAGQGEGEDASRGPPNYIGGVFNPWHDRLQARFPNVFLG